MHLKVSIWQFTWDSPGVEPIALEIHLNEVHQAACPESREPDRIVIDDYIQSQTKPSPNVNKLHFRWIIGGAEYVDPPTRPI